jgi:hypothetical protein
VSADVERVALPERDRFCLGYVNGRLMFGRRSDLRKIARAARARRERKAT